MRKYLKLFRNSFEVFLQYRANLIGSLFNELLPIFGAMIFWSTLFQSNTHIGTLNYNQTILYYILLPLVGSLTKSTIAEWFGDDIKGGLLSNRLLKPYKIWWGLLANEIAVKFDRIIIVIPIYCLAALVAYLYHFNFSFTILGCFVAMIIILLAFLLQFIMDKAFVSLAFWLDEIWFLKHLKDILINIFGGLLFPLDFLPSGFRFIFELLPFKYFYYTPISYLMGKRGSIEDIILDLTGILIWGIIFYIISIYMWKGGIKLYGAFGG